MITIALCGEQPDHHDEQNKVDGCVDKATGDQQIIDKVKSHVNDGKDRGPALGDYQDAALGQDAPCAERVVASPPVRRRTGGGAARVPSVPPPADP